MRQRRALAEAAASWTLATTLMPVGPDSDSNLRTNFDSNLEKKPHLPLLQLPQQHLKVDPDPNRESQS